MFLKLPADVESYSFYLPHNSVFLLQKRYQFGAHHLACQSTSCYTISGY